MSKLKVLHITTFDFGGAGLAVIRLNNSLIKMGIDSKILVSEKHSNEDSVFVANESTSNRYNPPKNPLLRLLMVCSRKIGLGLKKIEVYKKKVTLLQKKYPAFFTYPISSYELHRHPLVIDADIIHLHWISNFVDFPSFFSNIKKPIIWTLHDLNPMFGGFHHIRKREEFYLHYKEIEDELYNIKKKAITKYSKLYLVALSSEMEELIKKHDFFYNRQVSLIHNSVDALKFHLFEKKSIRKILNLPENKKILLFVNAYLNDSEKGLEIAIGAIDSIQQNDIVLVCVGEGIIPDCKCKTIQYHYVQDSIWLSMLYSAADLLLFPSYQEAFAQTPIEALCCGTPVVITPVSGAKDIITQSNGIISDDYTAEKFGKSISIALSRNYDSQALRSFVIEQFNPHIIAQQYINLYNCIKQ